MTNSTGQNGKRRSIFDLTTGEEKAAYPLGYISQFTTLVFAPYGKALAVGVRSAEELRDR